MRNTVIYLILAMLAVVAKSETIIFFANGASNFTAKDIFKSTDKLESILKANNLTSKNSIAFSSLGFTGSFTDAEEIFYQQTLSSIALQANSRYPTESVTTDIYLKNLGDLYFSENINPIHYPDQRISKYVLKNVFLAADYLKTKINDGDKIIIVAHSQGNLYTEAILAVLHYELGNSTVRKSVRVINLAANAASSYNQKWITISQDQAVNGKKYAVLVNDGIFKVLDNTEDACLGTCSKVATLDDLKSYRSDAHGFKEIYSSNEILSSKTKISLQKTLANYVQEAVNFFDSQESYSVSPTTAEISKDITFTVTGSNLTSGMGFAVDDCTPSSNELPGGTTTQRQFRCTINGIPGDKNLYLKDKPGGKILFTTKISATTNTSAKWLSTITPPDYVVKQFIYKDLSSIQNGNFSATGEYKINKDSIGCNLSQSLAVSGTRSNDNFNIRLEYNSDQTTCPDGTHTAGKGYVETYTGVMNSGVLFVTPQSACSFMLGGTTCYNFASFSPIQ